VSSIPAFQLELILIFFHMDSIRKFKSCIQSWSVTKKWGSMKSYSWYTAYYRPCLPCSADQSLIDRHLFLLRLKPAHSSTADLFVFWRSTDLSAHYST
jgi:hypothetical protein